MRICSAIANLHSKPDSASELVSQALFGEPIRLIERRPVWSYVQLLSDGYKGYVQQKDFLDEADQTTHRIVVRSTPLFSIPDIKSPCKGFLPLASECALQACEHEQFWQTPSAHFIWKQHTQEIQSSIAVTAAGTIASPGAGESAGYSPAASAAAGATARPAASAGMGMGESETVSAGGIAQTAQNLFLGAPYLWGGRTPYGLDCSAVVQLSALQYGWQLPRDTADQVAFFSTDNSPANAVAYAQRQMNDLIYWPGHVAIALDENTVVHATAHTLQCCCESLEQVNARAGAPTSIWRLH